MKKVCCLLVVLTACGGSHSAVSSPLHSGSVGIDGEGDAVSLVITRPVQVGQVFVSSMTESARAEALVDASPDVVPMRNDGYNCAGQLEIMAVNEEQKMTRGRFTVMFCATIEQRGDDRRDTEVLPEGAVVLVDRGADTTEEALVLVDGELAPEQRAVLERAFRVPRSGAQGSRAAFSEVLGLLGLDQPRRVGERWSLGSDAVLEILPEDLVNHDGLEAEGYAELFVFDGSRGLDEGTPCFGESCHELRVTLEASSLPSMMGERAVQDSANATITLSALIPFESSLPIWQADMRLSINASGTITAPGSDSPAVMLMNIVIDKRRVMTPLPSGQD